MKFNEKELTDIIEKLKDHALSIQVKQKSDSCREFTSIRSDIVGNILKDINTARAYFEELLRSDQEKIMTDCFENMTIDTYERVFCIAQYITFCQQLPIINGINYVNRKEIIDETVINIDENFLGVNTESQQLLEAMLYIPNNHAFKSVYEEYVVRFGKENAVTFMVNLYNVDDDIIKTKISEIAFLEQETTKLKLLQIRS